LNGIVGRRIVGDTSIEVTVFVGFIGFLSGCSDFLKTVWGQPRKGSNPLPSGKSLVESVFYEAFYFRRHRANGNVLLFRHRLPPESVNVWHLGSIVYFHVDLGLIFS